MLGELALMCVCWGIWWGVGWVEWVARILEFPSVWPPYRLGAFVKSNKKNNSDVGERPTTLRLSTLCSHCHDDNKHVSRHTPQQSAIRFTVHEIWWCFYWSKDLSLIIYRLLPSRLWCQPAPSTLRRIRRESGGGGVGGNRDIKGQKKLCVWVWEGRGKERWWKWVKRLKRNNTHPSCLSPCWVYQTEGVNLSGFFSRNSTNGSPSSLLSFPLLWRCSVVFEHWHLLITWSAKGRKKTQQQICVSHLHSKPL